MGFARSSNQHIAPHRTETTEEEETVNPLMRSEGHKNLSSFLRESKKPANGLTRSGGHKDLPPVLRDRTNISAGLDSPVCETDIPHNEEH